MARTKVDTQASGWDSIGDSMPPQDRAAPAAEEIAHRIQNLIITQGLAEGDRVPSERDLAKLLSTSRPTISHAIRVLVTRGLVESRRGSGIYVTNRPLASIAGSVQLMLDLREESVTQLLDLRRWLEDAGIAAAIENATGEDIHHSEMALRSLNESGPDTAAWMSADTRFHATLVRASGNPYLASIYESVHSALINYEYRAWIESGRIPEWLGNDNLEHLAEIHEAILDAVRERDVDAARDATLRHHVNMLANIQRSQAA